MYNTSGIVHDAMACASFLKFHPNLPKAGALVSKSVPINQIPVQLSGCSALNQISVNSTATRQLTKEERARQRHSAAEVMGSGSSGYYGLSQIQPGALDALTRSAANAAANRSNRGNRKNGSTHTNMSTGGASSSNGEVSVMLCSFVCIIFKIGNSMLFKL